MTSRRSSAARAGRGLSVASLLIMAGACVAAAGAGAQGATSASSSVTLSVGGTTVALPVPAKATPLPAVTVPTPPVVNVPAVGVSAGETPVVTVTPSPPPEGKTTKEAPAPGTENASNAPTGRAASSHASTASRSLTTSVTRSPRSGAAARGGASRLGAQRSARKASPAGTRRTLAPAIAQPRLSAAARAPSRRARARGAGSSGVFGGLPIPLPVPDWSKPLILALALIALGFAVRARTASRRARRLARAHAELSEDVGALQAALVPAPPAGLQDVEVSVAYRPADGPGAGGDFYDVFELATGRLAMILGDVAGHGRGALRQAALTRYTVRAYLQAGMSPRAALALAGTTLSQAGSELTATVAVALFDAETGALTYALAGHPPPILVGVDAPEPPLVCCSAPLGSNMPTGRRQTTLSLPRGASACFYTDGLTEARCSSGPKLLGERRLRELVEGLEDTTDASQLVDAVRHVADATPDDMAACILTSRAPTHSSAGCYIEELELDQLDLSRGRVKKFLRHAGVPADAVEDSIAVARATTRRHGGALLRVERAGAAATVSVCAPDAEATARLSESPHDEARAVEPALAQTPA